MSKSLESSILMSLALCASGCVTTIENGHVHGHASGVDAFDRPLSLGGYGIDPGVPITISVRNHATSSWDAVASTVTSTTKKTYGGDDFYWWSYSFVANDLLDSTCQFSPDASCEVGTGNTTPLKLRISQGGPRPGNLVTFDDGGLICTIDRINAGEPGTVAGFNCAGAGSPALDIKLKLSWNVETLRVSNSDACAIDGQGKVTCWGHASGGEPRRVTLHQGGLEDVALGLWANPVGCTLADDGHLACWGFANLPTSLAGVRQLAPSVSGNRICWVDAAYDVDCGHSWVPSWVANVEHLAVGNNHSCAALTNGDVQCWGETSNSNGQMSPPAGLGFVEKVAVGNLHSCSVDADGEVDCWGASTLNRLAVPTNLGTVVDISAGANHTCTVDDQGDVACWGVNGQGQSSVPGDLPAIASVGAGKFHTCARTTAGDVRCWGANNYGGSYGLTDVPSVFATP